MAEINLWEQVGNKCLERAIHALGSETAPTVVTAEAVKMLVETAISVDKANLQSPKLTESGMVGYKGRVFQQHKEANSPDSYVG